MMPPIPLVPVLGPCKYGSLQTRLPFMGTAGTIGASNYTLGATFTAETDFDWVRLFWLNWDTVSYTVNSAAVAVSAGVSNYADPINASGAVDNTLWKPVTFNNGGAAGDIPSPVGSVRVGTLPAAIESPSARGNYNDRLTGALYSDWIQIQSLTRTDAGATLPLIFTRSFSVGLMFCADASGVTGNSLVSGYNNGAAFDQWANGRIVRVSAFGGDQATTPTTQGSSLNTYLAPTGVQYLSRKRGLNLLNVGDSLSQGFGTACQQNDFIHQAACAMSTPSFPVCATKMAYQGETSVSFWQNAMTYADGFNPDVVFLKCESPNDTASAATYEASIARSFAFADWCTRRNIIPVLRTAEPFNLSATQDAARLAFNAAIRAAGWLYIDVDAVLTAGGTPAVMQSQYLSTTQSPHWNDAAATAVAQQQVIPILNKIMAGRPR